MVNIYIYDTGFIQEDFVETDGTFPTWINATTTEKEKGQFRAYGLPSLLKINNLNNGGTNNSQKTPSTSKLTHHVLRTSNEPFQYSMQGFIKVPTKYSDVTKVEDLLIYKTLILAQLSKGLKIIYLDDITRTDSEELFSMNYIIEVFGREETGFANENKFMVVTMDNVSFTETIGKLNYTIQFTILPQF